MIAFIPSLLSLLLAGAVSAVPEPPSGTRSFQVSGRVVYARPGGELVPLRQVRFSDLGSATAGHDAKPHRLKVKVSRTGEFQFDASASSETSLAKRVLLQAEGCDDLTLEVVQDRAPGTIEMVCPGRVNQGAHSARVGNNGVQGTGSGRSLQAQRPIRPLRTIR